MSATWDEIRGLAADLQRVQLASAKQRLTERNCIEIVQRLSQMGLIKLVYTCDGKAFLTEAELAKEIREELELHQHRVNVVALQEALNIDLGTVEQRVRELVKSDPELHLVNGELMHEVYFRRVAHEINEALYERGHVTLGELTKLHGLPTQTLTSIVRQYTGTVIQGSQEDDALFTDRYLRRHRARMRGCFNAAIRPLTVQQAASQLRMPEKLLRTVLDELHSAGELRGAFQGGKSTYVPSAFSAAHDDWARRFYAQNQYMELEAVRRCGLVSEPKAYLRRLLADSGQEPIVLKTCVVSPDVSAGLEAALDGVRWLDVGQAITVPLTDADVDALLSPMLGSRPDLVQVAGHYVISRKWLADLCQSFDQFLNERAEALVKSDPSLLQQQHQRRQHQLDPTDADDDGGGGQAIGKIKSGGGTQGREIKVKNTKNKYAAGRAANKAGGKAAASEAGTDSGRDRDSVTVSLSDVSNQLRQALEKQEEAAGFGESSVSDELIESVYELLSPTLNSNLQSRLGSVLTADSANKRQASGACQARAAALVKQMRLFERGAAALGDADLQATLNKHLAKSLGAALMCTLLEYAALSCGLDDCAKQAAAAASATASAGLTGDQRQKLVEQLPAGEDRDWLTLINLALNGDSMEKIHSHVDGMCNRLGLLLKPADKKAEKTLCAETAALLVDSLDSAEPELTLLVTVSLLVQACTGLPVHAPGRAVPQLINYLRSNNRLRDPNAGELLQSAQELVVRRAKRDETASEEIDAIFPRIVELGKAWKSASAKK
ncbi:hypothetical protein BOX15_Mlig033126g2 [Macrostomum lignano]|uniref:E3 UFM1-protein ligase 1 homolog n=1 Tax=Macrostomum lignano TaxID=282301 RepID=A0A267F1E7_9PLAT|nr:hypothetical protein BOX15_Mlig033126g2 [Macrostomum lignano]